MGEVPLFKPSIGKLKRSHDGGSSSSSKGNLTPLYPLSLFIGLFLTSKRVRYTYSLLSLNLDTRHIEGSLVFKFKDGFSTFCRSPTEPSASGLQNLRL